MENTDWHVTDKEVVGGVIMAASIASLIVTRGRVNVGEFEHIIPAAEKVLHEAGQLATRAEDAFANRPKIADFLFAASKAVPIKADLLEPISPSGELGRFVGEHAHTLSTDLSQTHFPMTLRGTEFKVPVNVGGDARSVTVHLPPKFTPEKPTSVYYLADGAQYKDPTGEMLHGYHWATTADENHFVAVSLTQSTKSGVEVLDPKLLRLAPQNTTWRTPHSFLNPSNTVNDITYFDNVNAGVGQAMRVDKVNFVGFCDGGNLAHSVASRTKLNGVASMAGTRMKDIAPAPLAGTRGIFTTVLDDNVVPPTGGPGRAFGKFLIKLGQHNITNSEPLEQAPMYAHVNGLQPRPFGTTAIGTERQWLAADGKVGAIEMTLPKGGHNWPGTLFDKASLMVARQISSETSTTFNQRIVDFFDASDTTRL